MMEDVSYLIDAGNAATAYKLLSRWRGAGRVMELPQPVLEKLMRGLLECREYAAAATVMEEHLRRFTKGRIGVRLNLAKVFHRCRQRRGVAGVGQGHEARLFEGSPVEVTLIARFKNGIHPDIRGEKRGN